MATVEQELIEKIAHMDEEKQMRVLQYVQSLEAEAQMTWDEWLEQARAFREQLRTKYGSDYFFNSQAVLDEVREERLSDLMGGG